MGLGAAAIFIGVAVLGPVLARPASRLLGAPLPALNGMPGTLAKENAVRNPKRTSATAAALMIGVSLVAFIAIFGSSTKTALTADIDKTFTSDFLIDTGSFAALSPGLAERLARLPEVGAASGVRANMAEIDGATADLVAVDPASYGRIVDLGVTQGRLEDLDTDGIAVLDTVARAKGWSVGEEVRVRFAETGERRLTVAAIFSDTRPGGLDYLLGLAGYEANFTDRLDVRVLVKRAEGVSLGACPGSGRAGDGRLPDGQAPGPGRVQAGQSAEHRQGPRPALRPARPGRPDRPAGHRQHPRPVGLRAHPGARPAAGDRHGSPPGAGHGPLGVGHHRPVRHLPWAW